MKFDELYWHDSIIKKIEVDRSNPGVCDIISFEIDWYDKGLGKLVFENVYWARLSMNFGIVADESIDDGFTSSEDDIDLIKLNDMWGGLINEDLPCYVIKTASTGSEIKIIAQRFRIDMI